MEIMQNQTLGLVICSCLSLHVLMACNPPSQTQQAGFSVDRPDQSDRGVTTEEPLAFQAQNRALTPEPLTAPPENITAPPQGITAPPENITAPPQNITAPPENITAPPQNITAPPQNLWVNPAAQPVQLALLNYHEVDASFYDARRLQQSGVGGYRTQLLGWVKDTVSELVEEVDSALEPQASPTPQTENSPLLAVGISLENVAVSVGSGTDAEANEDSNTGLLTPLLTATTEPLQQLPLVGDLLNLDLNGLLSRLLPVPRQALYRLQARDFAVSHASESVQHAGQLATLDLLQLSHGSRNRQVLTLMQGQDAQEGTIWEQSLTESGAGFVQQASRIHQWVAGQWVIQTEVTTTWDQGGSLKVTEQRLCDAQGMGTGHGQIEITWADGTQKQLDFVVQTQSDGGLVTRLSLLSGDASHLLVLSEQATGHGQLTLQQGEHEQSWVDVGFSSWLATMTQGF